MVGYIKNHFFVRYRNFESFAHLNQLALQWLEQEADKRLHGTVKEVVMERFKREAASLGPLPEVRYDTSYLEHRFVHWDGYIEVRGNRYSVPARFCGRMVTVRISIEGDITVYADDSIIARHRLQSAAEGWATVPAHHAVLWQQALAVERRDLSVYEEAIRCN
jgi:hypothetical protein